MLSSVQIWNLHPEATATSAHYVVSEPGTPPLSMDVCPTTLLATNAPKRFSRAVEHAQCVEEKLRKLQNSLNS